MSPQQHNHVHTAEGLTAEAGGVDAPPEVGQLQIVVVVNEEVLRLDVGNGASVTIGGCITLPPPLSNPTRGRKKPSLRWHRRQEIEDMTQPNAC